MKKIFLLLLAAFILALYSCKQTVEPIKSVEAPGEVAELDYYQLKIYSFENPEQESLLDTYLQESLLPALHRTGIEHVGVFKPIAGLNEKKDFLMVLTPFSSLNQFEQVPELLQEDSAYLQSASAYINAPHDAPPYSRMENMILRSFSATPKLALPRLNNPRSERVYELRSYEAATEKLYRLKVEMFNEGESSLFQDLKFNPAFFCEVLSSAYMPHLVYMTCHADTSAQKENWDAFGTHPEWDRLKNLERYQNTVSRITKYLLYPTEYSDY